MNEKVLSEQEWIYNYLQSQELPLPVVLGTKGTWGIKGEKVIIIVAFTMPDITVFRDIHNATINPIRKVKYKDIVYYAVNIVDKKQVEYLIDYWKEEKA